MLTAWDPNSEKSMDKDTKKKIDTAYNHAKDLWGKDKRIEALKSIEKTISVHRNQERCFSLHELQGHIFFKLAKETTISDIKRLYLFASLDAFSTSTLLCPTAVMSFHGYARSAILLGDQLGANKIYEKAFLKAKQGLAVKQPQGRYESNYFDKLKKELETLMNFAAEKKDAVVTYSGTSTKANQMVLIEKEHSEADTSFDQLKNFWVNLDDKTKR
ncbi:hypothetical protein V5N11_029545 [Cardamine amara subsp. amara]|uniref:DUF627 domain-containing protein n=1 Tax=Cardamine amara subsp. amara TaxID=228776 RepID=A0ABD1AKP4_CARAN